MCVIAPHCVCGIALHMMMMMHFTHEEVDATISQTKCTLRLMCALDFRTSYMTLAVLLCICVEYTVAKCDESVIYLRLMMMGL